MRPLALWLACSWVIACSVPAPGTDDDGTDGSAGAPSGSAGASGAATAGKAGASSGQGGAHVGGAGQGGASQAGSGGDPFGGGGAAGVAGSAQGAQGGAAQVCTPGQQIGCPCPGGVQGAQACNPSGTGYEPCDCPSPAAGAGGTSAGGSSAAGAAGSPSGAGGGKPVDPAGDADACPGATVDFAAGSIVLGGTTQGAKGDYDPPGCASAASTDVVYTFVAPKAGTVTATVTPVGFDAVVYWSTSSCSGAAPKACSASKGGYGEPESIQFPVSAGASYWVFVDGWTSGFAGAFTLSLSY
ncbi:MAG: hypothetical protein IT374_17135 [Polyangiaceae bacterium]|nr:hypothetical protein [Polyangiaceae bacterium]